MNYIIENVNIPVIICGVFYSILCIFSIVTGLMYASGKKRLNPLELSQKFMDKLDDEKKLTSFTKKMGWVTFAVGIVQGITAYSLFKSRSVVFYWIALGFTIFSISSVLFKLKGKINPFPLLKLVAYLAILVVIIVNTTKTIALV